IISRSLETEKIYEGLFYKKEENMSFNQAIAEAKRKRLKAEQTWRKTKFAEDLLLWLWQMTLPAISIIESIVQAIVISRIDYCMVLPLRTFASSNGCKTRHSDWCDHCQDTNTSHRHLYVFTGCRLSLESISRLLCSVSSAFMGQVSKKHGRQQEDFDIQPPLEH
ncbi:unnamed protein product, partial [Porites lobata]